MSGTLPPTVSEHGVRSAPSRELARGTSVCEKHVMHGGNRAPPVALAGCVLSRRVAEHAVNPRFVDRHPAAHADADGGDLVLDIGPLVGTAHPDPHTDVAPLAAHVEAVERHDDPVLETAHEAAQVLATAAEVEHHVGDPLTGPVIGELPAPAAREHREAVGLEEIAGPRRGAGRVERRMLDEPHPLR